MYTIDALIVSLIAQALALEADGRPDEVRRVLIAADEHLAGLLDGTLAA